MVYTFYIADLYTTTEVDEPRGWKDLMNVLDRDFETHGVFFKYTDGALKLGFACDGKTLLEAAYQDDGTEAFYQFLVDEDGVNIFTSQLDYTTRKYDEDYFEAEVNQIDNLVKLKNRAGSKINLNTQLSIDGDALSKMNYDDSIISLATKEFAQLIVSRSALTLDSVQSTVATSLSVLYANFGFDGTESTELSKYRKSSTEIRDSAFTNGLITFENDVAIEISFDYDFDLILTEDQGSGSTTYTANLDIYFDQTVVNSLNQEVTSAFIDTESDTSASPNDTTLTFTFDTIQRYAVFAGTTLRLELEIRQISTGSTQFSVVLDITKFDITITDKLGILGTQSQWYQLHDVLNKNLNFITGEYDYLYSELLGGDLQGYNVDGCFSNMLITNGSRVRQINDTKKAPNLSFKEIISNINSMDAVGYGIEELDSPISLGINDLFWVGSASGIATARIMGEDFTSDLSVGFNIGFYNSETIYGVYELTEVTFNPSYTIIKFDISKNSNYYGTFGDNPAASTTFSGVYITTDTTTELRDRLRVEEWEHFYKDTELIDLGVVQEYSEDPFNEAIYNKLDIGFRTFSNDENKPTTLEEIHTNSSWSFPLAKSDNSLDLKLSWIGSTFLFNDSRSNIFSKKPTTSNILDNKLFFCEKAAKEGTFEVDFSATADTITMPADAYENIINGSNFFNITGAVDAGNNTSYVIDTAVEITFNIERNEYVVPVTSVVANESADEVFIVSTFLNQKLFKPEADDFLTNSSGITRPSYFMNQRRTIKRFLIRWGKYINSFLYYVGNVTIQNLFYVNNGEFTSELDTYLSTDCLGGDSSYTPIVEEADVLSTSLATAKFKPNLISCTVKICDSDYDMIIDAHKNALQSPDEAKNYGYFTVTSPMGQVKTGWLMNLKRSPVNRTAKIQLLEKV